MRPLKVQKRLKVITKNAKNAKNAKNDKIKFTKIVFVFFCRKSKNQNFGKIVRND